MCARIRTKECVGVFMSVGETGCISAYFCGCVFGTKFLV